MSFYDTPIISDHFVKVQIYNNFATRLKQKNKRKHYSAVFKAEVAIDSIREHQTLQELSQKYRLSVMTINKWKSEFVAKKVLFDFEK